MCPRKSNNLKLGYGIIFAILAALFCSVMNLQVKLIANSATVSMVVFSRFTVSLVFISLVVGFKKFWGTPVRLRTDYLWLHVVRAVSIFISIYALYYILKYVPLTDATVFSMTYTFFVPALGAIFLGTKTSLKNWLALLVGFVGVIFVMQPFGVTFNPLTLFALISGVATAISMLGIHELAKYDGPNTVMFYSFAIAFLLSGLTCLFDWQAVDLKTLLGLGILGVTSTVYQWLLVRALLYASPKVVSPILYLGIVFSGLFDWLFWSHLPSGYGWFGMALIILGAIFSLKYSR